MIAELKLCLHDVWAQRSNRGSKQCSRALRSWGTTAIGWYWTYTTL